jgi:hypothetical protein
MTLNEALLEAYVWGVAHGTAILVAAVAIPIVGAFAATIGKGGRTDADGKAIASVVLGLGVLAMLGELIAIHVAHAYFNSGLLDADWRIALAPAALLGCSLVAIRWVFPLNELAGARSVFYLTLVFAGCWLLLRFFEMFEGWRIYILGSLFQLAIVLALAMFVLWRLFRRAFNPNPAE